MSRLTELAVSKRSVALLLAVALFIGGISAWGSLKQELLPDIDFPVITVIAPIPGAGAADVAEQVAKPIERAISSIPRLERVLLLGQLDRHRRRPVRVRHRRQGDVGDDRAEPRGAGLPANVTPQVTALNINASPVIIASVAGTAPDGLTRRPRSRARGRPRPPGLDGVATVDLTGGLESRLWSRSTRPGWPIDRHLGRPGQRTAHRQQPDAAVGPDHDRDEPSRSRRSARSRRSTRSRTSSWACSVRPLPRDGQGRPAAGRPRAARPPGPGRRGGEAAIPAAPAAPIPIRITDIATVAPRSRRPATRAPTACRR